MDKYVYETKARFSDIDSYGILHHSSYYRIIEEARIAFIKNVIGLSLEELEQANIRVPIVKAYCEYKKAVTYDDQLFISLKFKFKKSYRIIIHFQISNLANNVIFAEGYTEHIFINNKMKILPCYPDIVLNKLKMLKQADIFASIVDIDEIEL